MFKFSVDLIGRSGFFLPPLYVGTPSEKKVHVINRHLTIASYRGQCHTSKTPFIFALGQVDQKLQLILCRKFLDILVIK